MFFYLIKFLIVITFCFGSNLSNAQNIPNLKGTWVGENKTLSDQRGFRTWEKKVEIIEQKDRRFKGTFSYTDGKKDFFGVIHPDNVSFTWVAANSRGYNIGKILEKNRISACYVESGIDATAGCADLTRK